MITHHEIAKWTDDTFGPVSTNFRVATRANEELAEALRAIAAGKNEDALVEAADVIIVLCRPAKVFGLDWGTFSTEDSEHLPEFSNLSQYFTFANAFMARLLSVLAADDNHRDARMHIENIYRCLAAAIFKCRRAPQEVIDGKMQINHNRTWGKSGDGTGYHVRNKAAA